MGATKIQFNKYHFCCTALVNTKQERTLSRKTFSTKYRVGIFEAKKKLSLLKF